MSGDTPFLLADLVVRLSKQISNQPAVYVFDGEYAHSTILLIDKGIADQIKVYLQQGNLKLMLFLKSINAIAVDFNDKKTCFININTPENLEKYEKTIN